MGFAPLCENLSGLCVKNYTKQVDEKQTNLTFPKTQKRCGKNYYLG